MRVHAHTKPPGKYYNAWLNGKYVPYAIAADEEAGWVTHNHKDANGRWVFSGYGELDTRISFGKVTIIDQTQLPVPVSERELACAAFGLSPWMLPHNYSWAEIWAAWERRFREDFTKALREELDDLRIFKHIPLHNDRIV